MGERGWRHGRRVAAAAFGAAAVAVVVLGVPRLASARPSAVPSPQPSSRARQQNAGTQRLSSRMRGDAAPTHAAVRPALPTTVSSPLTARPTAPDPRIGALFFTTASGALSGHFCSATVVSSPTKDLVVTAAHCVYSSGYGGYAKGLAFVPGYANGKEPYGVWLPSKTIVDPHWTSSFDPDYDVAFLVVHRGDDRDLQDLTGADQMGFDSPYRTLVRVIAYPGTGTAPVSCDNYTSEQSPTQLRWDCAGYPQGTSGSPFLTGIDPVTGAATVMGVIGGYQTGGSTASTSYSTYFGSGIASLQRQALAAG
jgi:V8-like Glu-specific endopeptidase